MKTLILSALLALSFSANAAVARLDEPFVPGEDIRNQVVTSAGWVEVYKLEVDADKAKNKDLEATAVKVLVDKKKPEVLLSIAVDGWAYFSQEGAQGQLKEAQMTIKRRGAAIDYDDNCSVVPRAGDVLETTYRSDDGVDEAVLHATIREHHAYGILGDKATEAVELTLSKKEHCSAVSDSRIVAVGSLTFRRNNKVAFRNTVLVQYIAQP